jgi:hypothetical protein
MKRGAEPSSRGLLQRCRVRCGEQYGAKLFAAGGPAGDLVCPYRLVPNQHHDREEDHQDRKAREVNRCAQG